MKTNRRSFLVASAISGVFAIHSALGAEATKKKITSPEAQKIVFALSGQIYNDAKKYEMNFGDETPETVFKAVWPDARSILERRLFIEE